MKKLFLTLTALFFIFACSGKKEESVTAETKKTDAKVTVDIFQFKVEAKDALEKAAKEYMAKNPNVTISVQTVGGGSDYGAALRNQFASGKEPAIFNIGGRQDAKDWLAKLEDLSSVNVTTQAFSGTLDSVTIDGKVLAIPFNQEGYGLIVNKAVLEKAGINVDSLKSYKALEDAIKLLDSKKSELGLDAVIAYPTKETWVTGLHTSNVAIGQEFKSVVEAFDAPELKFTYAPQLKKIIDLQVKYGYKPSGDVKSMNSVDYATQVEKEFSMGKVAMIQQGNWAYGSIEGIDPELAKNITIIPLSLEGGKEDSIPVGVPNYWAINKDKDDNTKAAAKAFLDWLYTSPEGKKMIIEDFKFIPAYKGYEAAELQPKDPLAAAILKYSQEGKTTPWVFMGYPTGWGMDKLGANIQKYVAGEMPWDKLVEEAKTTWAEARKAEAAKK
ncbi:MAG: carbohydrate ABC transporter substrate-binding protein [Leptotrichiaceae bacterium]|nr:carbohydrate ABC transporter substrate-binding protein [Leptotrichiaceae bacterium]MBP9875738.1 carbohydrate ABC transporter substrate-binding protein [Leptotrichiaceae bacterium]